MIKIQRDSKGFTLIELLIVIAIIGILAAIAIPSYTGYVKRAKVQEVIHTMGAVKTGVSAYFTESNLLPPADLDIAGIKATLGVDVPIKYLAGLTVIGGGVPPTGVAGGPGTITATFTAPGTNTATQKAIGDGVDSRTIALYPDDAVNFTMKSWHWGQTPAEGSSIDVAYIPKN
jgi:type IV pilus assembly protein PilA